MHNEDRELLQRKEDVDYYIQREMSSISNEGNF
jgi:hypothetical protein